jgi:hypothetical protein
MPNKVAQLVRGVTVAASPSSHARAIDDSFINHANWNDVILEGQILKISFTQVHFSNFI